MEKLLIVSLIALILKPLRIDSAITKCEKSLTVGTGFKTINDGKICSGDLIFEETFESFDLDVWQHSNSLENDDNTEFQWYTNNRSNSFVEDGNLLIRPTIVAEEFGSELFLYKGSVKLADCTKGCEKTGTLEDIINPVKSARINSRNAFSFKYGKVEVSAKLPTGNYLVPSISLLPTNNAYGSWPASGEIDLVQARGNRELIRNKSNIGSDQIESSIHFGPYADLDNVVKFEKASKEKGKGFNAGFHRYQMEWDVNKITFSVDDIETGTIKAGKQGFWDKGNFETKAPGSANPWKYSNSKMAPFDQQFYFVINLSVGGKSFFSDDIEGEKSWKNDSPHPQTEFWENKHHWLPTWQSANENKTKESAFLIDYIRVWAL